MKPRVHVATWDRVFDRVYEVLAQEHDRAIEAGDAAGYAAGAIIGGAFLAFGAWVRMVGPSGEAIPECLADAELAMAHVVAHLALLSDAKAGRSAMDSTVATMRAVMREQMRHQHVARAAAATPTSRPQ